MTAPIDSLLVGRDDDTSHRGIVYLGLTASGDVFRYQPGQAGIPVAIGLSLGDYPQFGLCSVNCLALYDLDHNGSTELLASTSQVQPRGRPRLYLWGEGQKLPVVRAMARPDIQSSWGHSLALLERPGHTSDSLFITYCGFGEIVEYQLETRQAGAGFQTEAIRWKVVGQLPASGESLQVADADNDGQDELCVATGYSVGHAAIHFYKSDAPGAALKLERRLDEDGRFGNVRFLVGKIEPDGSRDLFAWWCKELAGGDTELIRYRLGAEGVRTRTVLARGSSDQYWIEDGQATLADVDGDGRTELWFATHPGQLWRFDPSRGKKLEQMARLEKSLGPIAFGRDRMKGRRQLYIAWNRTLLALVVQVP
jgi:hypothetical protein